MIGRQPPPKNTVRACGWAQNWRVLAVCMVLAAVAFAVFGQTAGFSFVNFDDDTYVYENAHITGGLTLKSLAWVFTHADCNLYHPLTMLSLMADYQLHGLHAGGYHLTNVLLHTASVILLFLILRQMTGALWRSAFVAAVFAIHPLRVESVAWVAERKDVLSGFFFMLTLGAYVHYARKPNSLARYLMVAAAFVLALLSKPTVVTLPFVLLLLDYWPLNRFEQPRKLSGLILEKIPLLALAAGACVMTVLASEKTIATNFSIPLLSRVGDALVYYALYLRQMVWPEGLATPYPYLHSGLPAWKVALAGALLAGLSAVAWGKRRTQPWLLIGWLWYLGMLTPMIGIVQTGSFAHADRYTYLPQIGIYVAVAWLVAKWRVNFAALGGLMAGVIAVLMACAWKQTTYWRNSETLWTRALACTAGNYIAHVNLGNALLLQKGRTEEVIIQYQEALKIKPDYADAQDNLGVVLFQKGRVDDAITHYEEALKINPGVAEFHNNLGLAFFRKERVDEAVAQYEEALKIDPSKAELHNDLGNSLVQRGQVDDAITQYRQALQIKPDFAEARNNLGLALFRMGKVDNAIIQYQEALKISPDYMDAHISLGNALLQQGRMDEAIIHFRKALQIKPDNVKAQNNLGNALLQMGRVDDAIAQYRQALQIKPDEAEMHYNLGLALSRKGKMDDAITQFQEALQIKPDYMDASFNLGNVLLQQGRIDDAITQFQETLQIKPDFVDARFNLGLAFARNGRAAEAITQFQEALKIGPANPRIQNNLAELLATCPDASLRNGDKAVELAQQANKLTGGENPIILHTLAAAFAEAGRFSEAVETAQHALRLAGAQSNANLSEQLQFEMKLYQAGRPYHVPEQTH